MKIAIIDYGMGNLFSVLSAINRAEPKAQTILATSQSDIQAADRIILPGQGAVGGLMRRLREQNLLAPLIEAAHNKPFFGMCLGPQAMLEHSAENGGVDTLGLIPGVCEHFSNLFAPLSATERQSLKIPHMGWNQVTQNTHPLWDNIAPDSWFYFVHSYYLKPTSTAHVAGTVEYGRSVTAAIMKENCFGVQFHPEKSAQAGLQLLKNFCHWNP